MKLPYTASCSSGVPDRIEVNDYTSDGEITLLARHRDNVFSVYLSAEDARKLAKAIKKAAKIAEASE